MSKRLPIIPVVKHPLTNPSWESFPEKIRKKLKRWKREKYGELDWKPAVAETGRPIQVHSKIESTEEVGKIIRQARSRDAEP
jgi:hypothetical protein